jgi:hypothetical protein
MLCIHKRILSIVGEVGLEVILNIVFILFSPMPLNKQGEFKEMIVMSDEVYDEDSCNDDDDSWAENCGFGMFYSRAAARLAERDD